MPTFLGIVSDVFPQHETSKFRDATLGLVLEEVLQQQQYQAAPGFVEKGMQIYETQSLRHGILVASWTSFIDISQNVILCRLMYRILPYCADN